MARPGPERAGAQALGEYLGGVLGDGEPIRLAPFTQPMHLALAPTATQDAASQPAHHAEVTPPGSLITHRQAINGKGDHVQCPGEAVVMMALRSPAVRNGLLVPDPDMTIVPEFGRCWPESWRCHLLPSGGEHVEAREEESRLIPAPRLGDLW